MAHGRPWYQRSGADFLMGTIGFPDVETRWVYSAIIDMLNDRDRPLADDAAFVCGFTGLSRKKWSIARAWLLERQYLVLTDDGELTNPRFERERAARAGSRAASVEGGRRGGKASAAKRAAAQGDLALDGGKSPDSTPESRVESTPDSTPEGATKVEPAPPENNDLAQAPPQGIARALETRDERIENNPTTTPPNPTGLKGGDVDAEQDRWDLLGITNRVAQAGAVSLHREYMRVEAMDLVKQWQAQGIDIERTVIPTVEQVLERFLLDKPDGTVGSLNFYASHVAKAHTARRRADRAQAGNPRASELDDPVFEFEGEDERFVQFRRDLLGALGKFSYVKWAHQARFAVETGRNDAPILTVTDTGPLKHVSSMKLMDGERIGIVKRVARENGLPAVW